MSELKPCPFCGGQVSLQKWNDASDYHAWCNACQAEGPLRDTTSEAIAAWNARPIVQAPVVPGSEFTKKGFLKYIDEVVLDGVPRMLVTFTPEYMAEVAEQYAKTLARADAVAETDGWIAVGERLPDSRQHVIAFYTNEHGKGRTSVCQYIAHATVLAEDFLSDDAEGCDVYDEERDCYWVDSGWWEASWEAETNWRITSTVTHWQPLPDAPGGKE